MERVTIRPLYSGYEIQARDGAKLFLSDRATAVLYKKLSQVVLPAEPMVLIRGVSKTVKDWARFVRDVETMDRDDHTGTAQAVVAAVGQYPEFMREYNRLS